MAKDPSLLFHPNPPPEEWRARLFHNRLKELDIGLSKLRSTAASTELLAIHGDTRTGKSHYAHRLLDLAIEELGGVAVIVNANQRETAQHVLEDLFASLAIELQGLDRSHVQDRPVYDELIQFIEVFKPLVFGKVQEKELTEGRKLLSKTSATLGLKPTFAEFSLGFEASTEDGTSEKVVLHAPQGEAAR